MPSQRTLSNIDKFADVIIELNEHQSACAPSQMLNRTVKKSFVCACALTVHTIRHPVAFSLCEQSASLCCSRRARCPAAGMSRSRRASTESTSRLSNYRTLAERAPFFKHVGSCIALESSIARFVVFGPGLCSAPPALTCSERVRVTHERLGGTCGSAGTRAGSLLYRTAVQHTCQCAGRCGRAE